VEFTFDLGVGSRSSKKAAAKETVAFSPLHSVFWPCRSKKRPTVPRNVPHAAVP